MTAVSSFVSPRFQAFAPDTGGAAVGYSLYTYLNNTTTPKTTWQDGGGTTPNSNPIILDSTGGAVIYLDGTVTYEFVLKNPAGGVVWTQTNIKVGDTAAAISAAATAVAALSDFPAIARRAAIIFGS